MHGVPYLYGQLKILFGTTLSSENIQIEATDQVATFRLQVQINILSQLDRIDVVVNGVPNEIPVDILRGPHADFLEVIAADLLDARMNPFLDFFESSLNIFHLRLVNPEVWVPFNYVFGTFESDLQLQQILLGIHELVCLSFLFGKSVITLG